MNNYKQIAGALNVQLKGLDGFNTSLTSGLRLAVKALADEFAETDPSFDRLQFEFDCFKHTKFSDGGKRLQVRETYMNS